VDFKSACSIDLDIKGLRLLYSAIKRAHETWPPEETDCDEVRFLADMKIKLYGCMMEYLYTEH
jgi:hypothetical protein